METYKIEIDPLNTGKFQLALNQLLFDHSKPKNFQCSSCTKTSPLIDYKWERTN